MRERSVGVASRNIANPCGQAHSSPSARPAAAQEGHCTEQIAEIVPATRIGEGVNPIVGEKTTDEGKEDEEPVQQPKQKPGGLETGATGCVAQLATDNTT